MGRLGNAGGGCVASFSLALNVTHADLLFMLATGGGMRGAERLGDTDGSCVASLLLSLNLLPILAARVLDKGTVY